MCHQVVNKTLLLLHPPQVRDKTKVRVLTDMLQLLLVMPKVSFLQSDALCFTLNTCTFIVLWSRKSGTMMYFKFSISPSVNNHSSKLSATRTHTHAHLVVGEVIKCLVLSQSNAVHCSVNSVYCLSLAWPESVGSDSPLAPQWGHNCRQTEKDT